jgi:hypothetical protein
MTVTENVVAQAKKVRRLVKRVRKNRREDGRELLAWHKGWNQFSKGRGG